MADTVYMGIDYGERRTGVAVSDASGLIASGRCCITGSGAKDTARQIVELAEAIQPKAIIVGYPVAADGGAGERCRAVDEFIAQLKELTSIPLEKQDERHSSAEARETVHAHGKKVTRKRREAGTVDMISAAIILQRWLDGR